MMLSMLLLQCFFIIFLFFDNFASTQNHKSNMFLNNTQNDIYPNSLVDCIVSPSYKYVPCGATFTVVYSTYFIDDVSKLLSTNSCYSFLFRSFTMKKWRIRTDVYLFFIENYYQMCESFKIIPREIFFNARAHFFIVFKDLDKSEYSKVFHILLKLNIFNVLVINKSKEEKFIAYTYHALGQNNCGRTINKIEEIHDCTDIHSIKTDYTHLNHILRNCTISVAAITDILNVIVESKVDYGLGGKEKGMEQYILDNIAQRENLTIEYIYTGLSDEYGVVLTNLTVTGVLGYLYNNTADIVIGGYTLIKNRVDFFEYIWGNGVSSFYIFTPASGEEIWKKVYQEFGVGTWLLIGLSYVFATVVIIVIRRFLVGNEDKRRIVFKIWGYLYGQTDTELIKLKKMKKIIIFWIWFTFFITSFYNSALYSLMSGAIKLNPKIYRQSLSALSGEPCVSFAARIFYEFAFNVTLPDNTNANCKLAKDALHTVANNVKYYGLEIDYTYRMRKSEYRDENGDSKLNSERFGSDVMLAMYTTRGFPLRDKLQRYTAYHLESGLLQRQRSVIYHQYVTPSRHHRNGFKSFRLSDFRIHYALLIIGYTISFICFIIESNWNMVSRKFIN